MQPELSRRLEHRGLRLGRYVSLVELGRQLHGRGYAFTSVTPTTHARVLPHRKPAADGLRDVFGWNLPFAPDLLPPEVREPLLRSQCCRPVGELLRSTVRFSTLAGRIFVHSGFGADESDEVCFGPDTYRFASAILRHAPLAHRVVDVGCGAGAGGIVLGERTRSVVLADVNECALIFAAVNAALAGIEATVVRSDVLAGVTGPMDLVIAKTSQAHGVRVVREALARLYPGGTLLLYTGSAIVDGRDTFLEAVQPLLERHTATYEELDPDVLEAVDRPGSEDVERTAAVLLRVGVGPRPR